MYKYVFKLKFAKKKTELNFDVCGDIIEEAVDNINRGAAFKRDGKRFSIDEMEKDVLTLTLFSENLLVNPSRSVSALTRYCTTYYTDKFEKAVYNKTIFSIEMTFKEKINLNTPNDISNEELLKGMIDLLYGYTPASSSDKKARNETIQEMKSLIAPYLAEEVKTDSSKNNYKPQQSEIDTEAD